MVTVRTAIVSIKEMLPVSARQRKGVFHVFRTLPHLKRTDTDDMKALIKSNCNFACRKRCPTKFKEGLCKKVRDSFWALDEAGRKRWLARFVENDDVDERKTGRLPHKLFYFFPTLPNSRGDKISVCQKFFFVALGYENSCAIAELLQQLSSPESSDQSIVKVETSGVAFQDEHLQGRLWCL